MHLNSKADPNKSGLGIRSFTLCSFAHFAQIKWATVSDSLRSLKTNERLWAYRSGRSRQINNRERIAQVTHDKWAYERLAQQILAKKSNFLVFFINVFYFSDSLIPSFLMSDVSESLRSLTKNERCEWIAQVAHQKWGNEQIANFFEWITHLLIFSQKQAIRSENWWANSQPWNKLYSDPNKIASGSANQIYLF